ncbi:MAG: GNAT family N-acetyltransferase [Planctomycetaceae bacterium]|nr:GNAT family N-acetyltransferase [Planctomycetaceae bacterium]
MPAELSSIRETISQCNAEEWDEIVRASLSGILMNHGFVVAVEEAFENQARFAHAVVYDDGQAVACGSFCAFPIDLNLLADGSARRITEILSKQVPSMMRKKVVFCGLPVSVGAKHLAIAPGARHEDVLRTLHEIAVSLARREHAPYIVFKEFPAGDCPKMDFLQQLGYRRFSSPAMNTFGRRFADIDAYVDALRSRYRQCVRKSLDKSRAADLRYERLTDTGAILRLYSPSLHRLYEAVALSSTHRLELLPLSFFHSLARHLPGLVGLTLVYAGDRVAAFNWNLLHGGVYHFLFAGLDYDLNPSLDLYFNLMYAEMDQAFRAGAETLVLGQTADDFKSRLGCRQERRFFYIASVGLVANLILEAAGRLLLPEPPPPPIHHVFRDPDPPHPDRGHLRHG